MMVNAGHSREYSAVQKRMAARDMKWFAANSKKQEQERQHQLQMDREARRRYMVRSHLLCKADG